MNSRSPHAKRLGPVEKPPGSAPGSAPTRADPPSPANQTATEEASSVRWTLLRVIVAQVVALWLLWLLQARYHI